MPDNIMKIKLQVQNQKANEALKDTGKNIKDIENKAKGSEKELGRMRIATAGLRRTMGALRNNLLLVSFAFGGTIAALSKTVKAYGEQELAEKTLSTALGHTSQALLDQASALQSVTTFGDENIIQAQALIAAFTDDEEAIKRATEATLDLAAAKGMDLFAAADLVAKTLGSTTNAMSRYGIEVTGAVGSTERLNTLTQNIAETFGGQAKAQAETLTGSLAQMGNAVGDTAESIGGLLAPAVIVTAGVVKTLAEELNRVITFHDRLTAVAAMDVIGVMTTEQVTVANLTQELENMTKKDIVNRLSTMFDGMSVKTVEQEMGNLQNMMKGIGDSTLTLNTDTLIFNDALTLQFDLLKLLIEAYATAPDGITAYGEKYQEFVTTQLTALDNYRQEQSLIADFIIAYEDEAKALGLVTDATKEKAKEDKDAAKAKEDQIKMGLQGANKMASAMVSLSKGNKQQTIAALHFSQAAAFASAVEGSMKAFGKGGVGGFILGTALLTEGLARVQQINQQISEIKAVKPAQFGANEIVSQPTMFLAGEAGAEQVSITPLEGPNIDGPQGGSVTVNVSGNVMTNDFVENELAEAIREAARRGTDFGVS